MKRAIAIAITVTIGILLLASILLGWGLKVAIAKNGKLDNQLEETQAKLDGWVTSYNLLYAEHKRVNQISLEVIRENQANRQAASDLERRLRLAMQQSECAQETIPDGYIDTLVSGLPSRRKAAAAVHPGGDTPTPDGPAPLP